MQSIVIGSLPKLLLQLCAVNRAGSSCTMHRHHPCKNALFNAVDACTVGQGHKTWDRSAGCVNAARTSNPHAVPTVAATVMPCHGRGNATDNVARSPSAGNRHGDVVRDVNGGNVPSHLCHAGI